MSHSSKLWEKPSILPVLLMHTHTQHTNHCWCHTLQVNMCINVHTHTSYKHLSLYCWGINTQSRAQSYFPL